jgi:class 3 adenylate cyclase
MNRRITSAVCAQSDGTNQVRRFMKFLRNLTGQLGAWMRGRDATTVPSRRATDTPTPRLPSRFLAAVAGSRLAPARHEIVGQLEIGRDEAGGPSPPGFLLLRDENVSRRHCIVSQGVDGRCFLRDLSRNGTRLNGRRVLPNMELEFCVGQVLDLGFGIEFVLEGDAARVPRSTPRPRKETNTVPNLTFATVLIGDIRDYTVLVRTAPPVELQRSVGRVFELLAAAVVDLGGTVKEFPGDAIVAYWEGSAAGEQVVSACRGAIGLDRLAEGFAADPAVWSLRDHPLRMDWALATGPVVIDSIGGENPLGLSMVGEPIVLASRLEKFANDRTGRILTCSMTRQLAAKAAHRPDGEPIGFVDLGPMQAKGFDRPDQVFALRESAS